MRFYVSKCNNKLNGKKYSPEKISQDLCVNPYNPVKIDKNVNVNIMIDSGAYQDIKNESRISFEEALERQLQLEDKIKNHKAEAIVSYDRLVDEQLDQINGQIKKRVSQEKGKKYVKETIEAAKFLSKKREELGNRKLILSLQGTTVGQYEYCLDNVLKFATKDDIIGLGGFCIVSKKIDYEQQYYEVLKKVIPRLKDVGINRLHIFGLGKFRPLIQTDIYARLHDIQPSYDTSSPELNSVFGRVFNPNGPNLSTVFEKSHKKNGYHPANLALFNIKMVKNFWEEHSKLDLPESFEPSYTPR